MISSEKTFRKTSQLFGILLALLFIAGGLYLYFIKAEETDISNPKLVKIVGAANIVFFGGLLLFAVYRKTRKN